MVTEREPAYETRGGAYESEDPALADKTISYASFNAALAAFTNAVSIKGIAYEIF